MLKKRLNNKKGFTLAELLVAVAIIGILVAISVPVFTSKLADAKTATDRANMRAAKAAAVTKSLEGESGTFYYDAAAGKLLKSSESGITSIKSYGQSSAGIDGDTIVPSGKILQVIITANTGDVTLTWVTVPTAVKNPGV